MSHSPGKHRYSFWDGSQRLPLNPDDVLGALADDLMEHGDLRWAMRNLMSRGMTTPQGGQIGGLREMLRKLRKQKQEQLDKYNLDSIFDNFKERLDEIIAMERQRIEEWKKPQEVKEEEESNFSNSILKDIAANSEQILDSLSKDIANQVKALEKYEFLNPDAQKKFLELLNELRKAITNNFFNNVESMVNNMSNGDIDRMKVMLKALNDLLNQKIAGKDPDSDGSFDEFMDRFGDMFGDNPPQSLDELLNQMQQQMAAASSLMNSLSGDQRQQLAELMQDKFGDPELNSQLRKLAKEMDFLNPQGNPYQFNGDQPIDLQDAMDMLREMRQMDELSAQLQDAQRKGDLDQVDQELLKELLGEESGDDLTNLKELMKALEDAGYMRSEDGNKWELTPKGNRMIGQKALGEIYTRLKKQTLGNHALPEEGRFGERLEQTKAYEFGDPFHLHMPRTIRNALNREGPRTPVQLKPDDFEIYRSEMITSTATAMLVDLSWSMALRGSFQAAKKVALALHNLITSQYPKDNFYIIGFAAYAKELKAHELPYLQWDEYVLGTNMQHALLLAERLLAQHQGGTKQIIMISDGEPTAHLENGEAQFAYPPTPQTLSATLKAVRYCTKRNIAINTFMLDADYYLKAFMDEIAKINGGRVFYTEPENLGEYILVDYVQNKKKHLSRR